jgi:cation transport ATPase
MSTRFGRRTADSTFEYHDSKESLDTARRREHSETRASLFGFIGLVAGGLVAYFALLKIGADLPKWLRFSLVLASAGVLAFVLAKWADLIWNIVLSMLLLAVLWGIGSWIWRVV